MNNLDMFEWFEGFVIHHNLTLCGCEPFACKESHGQYECQRQVSQWLLATEAEKQVIQEIETGHKAQ